MRINAIPSTQHIYRIPLANFHGTGCRCQFHFYFTLLYTISIYSLWNARMLADSDHFSSSLGYIINVGINCSVWVSSVLNSINSCCQFISFDCVSHTCDSYFCRWTGNHLTCQSMHCSASIRRKTVIVFEIINYKFAIWKHVKFSIWNIHILFVHERNEVN